MDGTKFAKMLSDKHLFELDRMAYKYSAADVKEFSELLRQNFAQPLIGLLSIPHRKLAFHQHMENALWLYTGVFERVAVGNRIRIKNRDISDSSLLQQSTIPNVIDLTRAAGNTGHSLLHCAEFLLADQAQEPGKGRIIAGMLFSPTLLFIEGKG